MTWYYDPSNGKLEVYDQTGTLVFEGMSFSGTWSNVPEPVHDCMADAVREAAARGDLEYAAEVIGDAIADDIEEGQP